MIRVAAVGDVHYGVRSRGHLRPQFEALQGKADLLLLAGDLTQQGAIEEIHALVDDLRAVPVPIVAVLGNHDYHTDHERDLSQVLQDFGVHVLEGSSIVLRIENRSVGVVGIKGFGGGFAGACITPFGEHEMKAFANHSRVQAEILRTRLGELKADFRFVLTHFSPVEATLLGEKREIYPFLGSYLLAEAIDSAGADAAFHGHAHLGTERGSTPGGVPVRNVAQPVIRHAYNIYTFEERR